MFRVRNSFARQVTFWVDKWGMLIYNLCKEQVMSKLVNGEKVVADKIPFVDFDKVFAGDVALKEFKKAFHEEIEIKYCYQGSFGVLTNSTLNYLTAGDIVITNPYDIHSNVDLGQAGRYYMVILDLDVFSQIEFDGEDLRRQLISGKVKFNNLVKDNVEMQALIKGIALESQAKKPHYKLCVQGMTQQLIALLLRQCVSVQENKTDKNHLKLKNIIVPALSKIHTDYAKELSIDELSGLCMVSKSHFCRTFKKAMGVTPVQYINSYRIDVASAMLKNTDESCGAIAGLCGFEDQSYFYRLFKLLKGVSPTSLRK